MGNIIPSILFAILAGGACAILARSRGRSEWGWFTIGFFAPVLGIILLLVLPDQELAREQYKRERAEQQRLRELIRKDRHVADRRQLELEGRLSAHDRALGLDTSQRRYLTDDEGGASVPPPLARRSSGAVDVEGPWFYEIDGKPVGPLALDALRSLWMAGSLEPDALVWTDGLADWTEVNGLPDLREALVG